MTSAGANTLSFRPRRPCHLEVDAGRVVRFSFAMTLPTDFHPLVVRQAPPAGGMILTVEAPRRATTPLLAGLAPLALEGRPLYCVDGANRFDPYAFSLHARRWGVEPEAVLDRVFVTRAFTIHQLQAVVEEMLPPLGARWPAPVVAVLGLDELFREESLAVAERRLVLGAVAQGLRALRTDGMRLVVTHAAVPGGERWWEPLRRLGDVHCRAAGGEGLDIHMVRCLDGTDTADIQHLPAGANRLLAAFSARAAGRAQGGV